MTAKSAAKKMPVVFDLGNNMCKAAINGEEGIIFPHGVEKIDDEQWQQDMLMSAGGNPLDYIMFNGERYRVANAISPHARIITGPEKYTKDYFPVLMMRAWAALVNEMRVPVPAGGGVSATFLYPFSSTGTADLIRELFEGQAYSFSAGKENFHIEFNDVKVVYESVGGYAKYAIKVQERVIFNAAKNASVLVIDIGGGTTQAVVFNQGVPVVGNPAAHSEIIGINDALQSLQIELQSYVGENGRPRITSKIPLHTLIRAMIKRSILVDGTEYPIDAEIKKATANITKAIRKLYANVGAAGVGINTIVLTGGGGAVMEQQIRDMFQINVELAAPSDKMVYANVLGMALLRRLGEQ